MSTDYKTLILGGITLAATGCPDKAAYLDKRPDIQLLHPPADFLAWEEERLRNRGLVE